MIAGYTRRGETPQRRGTARLIWRGIANVADNAAGSKRHRAKPASRPIPARVHPVVRSFVGTHRATETDSQFSVDGSTDAIFRKFPNLEGLFSRCAIAASLILPFAGANAIFPSHPHPFSKHVAATKYVRIADQLTRLMQSTVNIRRTHDDGVS